MKHLILLSLLIAPLLSQANMLQKAVIKQPAPNGLVNFLELSQRCAPDVAPETLAAIARTESGLNPYAIGVNKGQRLKRQPQNYSEAVNTAKALLASGANFDMGLAQINSKNLKWVNKSVEQLFDPCHNLQASAFVLKQNFQQAKKAHGDDQKALQAALSAYNTGSYSRGFGNGYVRKVINNTPNNVAQLTLRVPAIRANAPITAPSNIQKVSTTKKVQQVKSVQPLAPPHSEQPAFEATVQTVQQPPKQAAAWDVFADF